MEHQVDMLLTYRLDEYESDSEFLSHIESATVGRGGTPSSASEGERSRTPH